MFAVAVPVKPRAAKADESELLTERLPAVPDCSVIAPVEETDDGVVVPVI